jgi:DNA-binding MarR family transcriptional regulator
MSENKCETMKDNPNLKEAREHMKAAHSEMHKSIESLLPEGFVERRRKARKEMLLAVRSLVNAAIEKVEEKKETPA